MSDIFDEIKTRGLTRDLEERLIDEFGARGKNAIATVSARKVKRYKDFFVVQGKKGEYIVEDDFCTCNDYLYRLSIKGGVCYHSIAVKLARATGEYETVDQWYSDIRSQNPIK